MAEARSRGEHQAVYPRVRPPSTILLNDRVDASWRRRRLPEGLLGRALRGRRGARLGRRQALVRAVCAADSRRCRRCGVRASGDHRRHRRSGDIAAHDDPRKQRGRERNHLRRPQAHPVDRQLPLTYAWNFGDGSSGSGSTPTHSYAAAGSYTVTLIVTDALGAASAPATTTATINPAPVASVDVSPASASIPVGESVQLTATPRDASGNPLLGRAITWASDNSGVATVNANGLVTAVATGTADVSATSDGQTGSSAITDTPPLPSVTLVGAGNIANCGTLNDDATATLLDNIAGTVYTTGDNIYGDGSLTDFQNCYGPSWGRHKARTRPAVGHKDYQAA